MRISDWSSDVCSSDLSTIPDPFPDNVMAWIGVRVEKCLGLMDALEIDSAPIVGNSMGGALTLQLLSVIGRESCRERVCPYVSIQVVAASLKKQIDNKTQQLLTHIHSIYHESSTYKT